MRAQDAVGTWRAAGEAGDAAGAGAAGGGEVTLFIRSLPALTGLMSAPGPALARQQGRRGLAAVLAASTVPLAAPRC